MNSLATFVAAALVIFAIGQAIAEPAKGGEVVWTKRPGSGSIAELAMPLQPTKATTRWNETHVRRAMLALGLSRHGG